MAAQNKIADGFIDASILDTKLKVSRELMEKDLAKSGLTADDLYAEPKSLPSLFCPRGDLVVGSYVIPYFDSTGAVMEHMWRERVFYKDGSPKDLPKYVQPNGEYLIQRGVTRCMPYLYPHGDSSKVLFITEGEKKAVKASDTFGVRCIGIGGKDMWHAPDIMPRILHPEIIKAIDGSEASTIVVVADPDILEKEGVRKSYAGLLLRLNTQYPDRTIRVVAPPEKVDDWLAETEVTLDEFMGLEDVEGMDTSLSMQDLVSHYGLIAQTRLTRDGDSVVVGVIANEWNCMTLLEKHPTYAGSLRLNEDTQKLEIFGQELKNNLQDTSVLCTLQKSFYIPKLPMRVCQSAIKHVAAKHGYSPAVDDIMKCVEDADIGDVDWFEEIFEEHLVGVMRALVCGYVTRVLNAGVDWRVMVILAGPQKVGKTGCARWVTGGRERVYDFHAGQLDGKDKDILKRLMRPGIALFDDIDTFGRAEKGRLKAIITQQHTTMRGAYKEHEETYLRRGIMMGTTNDPQIIPDDPTGNTRFAVGLVKELLPFERMYKHRAEIIAYAHALIGEGYNADDIDFVEMSRQFTERSAVTEALEEFVASVRDGTYKPNGVDVYKTATGRLLFKASRYWQYVTGRTDYRPKDFERKEMGLRARSLGLVWHDANDKVLLGDGEKIKNVWEIPLK